jgi:3-hydroxyacyl-CoA dehydrogenase
MSTAVRYEIRGSVFLILVDSPPVNALSQAVRAGLAEGVARALGDAKIHAIVLACAGRTFIAGADITEFGKPIQEPFLHEVLKAFDASDKPIVAAIHGTALGGGLEVALACHYRVATPSARCGLPEVKLGIIPGAGGTQRLPRLVGVPKAVDMITGGAPIGAEEAKKIGLVDAIAQGELLSDAIAFAEKHASLRPLPRVSEMNERTEAAREAMSYFDETHARLKARARGAQAPLRALAAIRAAVELPFVDGLARERELIVEAFTDPESKAMRHVFFAERAASKVPDVPSDVPRRDVKRAAVIGAGTMGGGIAMVFANAGIPVVLVDREASFLDKGMALIEKNYAATVQKGRLTRDEMAARMARITTTTDYAALADSDLVVEAVFEEMGLKKEIFQKLGAVCRPDALLATNTSTLDVNAIAAATAHPERVLGLHFFSPANVMRLLEVVRAERTDKSVIATAMHLAKTLGKVGVLVGVCHGFVGNRMLHKYQREANFLVQEGARPEQVDRVLTEFGMAMGPFATSDLAGIDVGWRIRQGQGLPPKGERYFGALLDRLAEMGRFGQKTGKGVYLYPEGSRKPVVDPEVEGLIEAVAREQGVSRRVVGDEEIFERCMFAMVGEGAKILEEKIALRASDIDTVWVNGYGFPPHRGGPMFHADLTGLDRVLARIREFRKVHGPLWEPSPLLVSLAESGKTFASLDESAS